MLELSLGNQRKRVIFPAFILAYFHNRRAMQGKYSHFWLKLFEIILLIIAFFMAVFLILRGLQLYWREPNVVVKIESGLEIGPNDSIILSFNQSVQTALVEKEMKIMPEVRIKTKWLNENSRLEIKPVSYFEPGQRYFLEFSVPKGFLSFGRETKKFSFTIHSFPQVTEVVPGKGEITSVDSDFRVTFNQSVYGYNINFEINPEAGFQWEADDEGKIFRIFPQGKLSYETNYLMRITAQPVSNGFSAPLREIFSGTFQTEKKPVPVVVRSNSAVVPEEEVVDNLARLESGKYIDINLSKQHLSIFENGMRLGTYRISAGKRGMATPTGSFKILSKRSRAWSNKYKLFMPYWMQFTPVGHGIHELPEWPGGYKEGVAHLGRPVSHGCVRLGVGPAKAVYEWADIGIPVIIHY